MCVTALCILLALFTFGPAQQALSCPTLSRVGNREHDDAQGSSCEGLSNLTSGCFPNWCCSQQDSSGARQCVFFGSDVI